MPIFTVTNGSVELTVRAACRSCARSLAVEYVAQRGPTASWRDPEVTRVAMTGPCDSKAYGVIGDIDYSVVDIVEIEQ